MSKSNCKLLTAAIVSALHPNEAIPAGTVFNPKEFQGGEDEAKALVLMGYAEFTDEKSSFSPVAAKEPAISGEEPNDDKALNAVLEGNVDDVKAAIASGVYSAEQIKRLGELNTLSAKPRAGVEDAVADALKAAE
jgi:hypothetical protein